MNIVPYGDRALLINFEQAISPEINDEVTSIAESITKSEISGIEFITPAYCSLVVGFNPDEVSFHQLKNKIGAVEVTSSANNSKQLLTIPVCYAKEFAMDKEDVMKHTGFNWEEIIQIHTSQEFRVYMLGFLPGFVYMGKVPSEMYVARKKSPRIKVPALSVGLAGLQTGIYPSDAPGGWQIIGRTPVRIFDYELSNPFLFKTGMKVRFRSIDTSEFESISNEIIQKTFERDSLYG